MRRFLSTQRPNIPSTFTPKVNSAYHESFHATLKRCTNALETERAILNASALSLDTRNCVLSLELLSKNQSNNEEAVQTILSVAKKMTFSPKELSSFCFAVAKGKLQPRIPDFIVRQLLQTNICDSFQVSHYIVLLKSFELVKHKNDTLLQQLIKQLEQKSLVEYSVEDFGLLLQSLASFKLDSKTTHGLCVNVTHVLKTHPEKLEQASMRDLSLFSEGLARVGFFDKACFQLMYNSICERHSSDDYLEASFTGHELISLLKAFAHGQIGLSALELRALAEKMEPIAALHATSDGDDAPSPLALLTSFASMGGYSLKPDIITTLLPRLSLNRFSLADFGLLLNALHTMQYSPDEEWFQLVSREIQRRNLVMVRDLDLSVVAHFAQKLGPPHQELDAFIKNELALRRNSRAITA